jgi:PBP1b-binding outer membrane lipoprotein LpoB
MKKQILSVIMVSFFLFSCGNEADTTKDVEIKKTIEKDEVSDEEMDKMFDESMEDLDEDVKQMEKESK